MMIVMDENIRYLINEEDNISLSGGLFDEEKQLIIKPISVGDLVNLLNVQNLMINELKEQLKNE